MERKLDLIVHAEKEHYHVGLCCRFDWVALSTVSHSAECSLEKGLTDFLNSYKHLYDTIGKIVMVIDAAENFPSLLAETPRRIGYIRIAQDQYEPEYMMQLLAQNGGELLIENIRPGRILKPSEAARIAERFLHAGITDVAILGAFHFELSHERQMIINLLNRTATGRFTYHTLESQEYESFLLSENRLLADACLKEALSRKVRQIEHVCRDLGYDAPLFLLSGEGYCLDLASVLKDPLKSWQAEHAAKLIGASRLLRLSDAVAVSLVNDRIVIDRVKDNYPVAMGRTKQFFGLQISGPFTGAIEFSAARPRQRILEAIQTVNTEPGPLPIIDMTGGLLDSLELETERYIIESLESALITGAQCAPFRMDFYGSAPQSSTEDLLKASLHEEADRWMASSRIRLRDFTAEYISIKARYMKEGQKKGRMRISGHLE